MGKCKFKKEWLHKTDQNGILYSKWAKKFSDTEGFCIVCDTKISVIKGIQGLSQHAATSRHKENAHIKLQPRQLHLTAVMPAEEIPASETPPLSGVAPTSSYSVSGTIALHSERDSATTAEIIWTLKALTSDFSASSSNGITDTFKAMFPGAVPENFSMSSGKMKYLITDGLGPYFKEKIVEDVLQSPCYTIQYDETTNNAGKKELQVMVRYWSNSSNQVESSHLETFFLGKATGEILVKHINLAIDNAQLPRQSLIMIGSDGPNVNKTVHRLMNEDMKSMRGKQLLDLGSCTIHTVHNAFRKGIEQFGVDIGGLVIEIYYYFKNWPSRCEDFSKIQSKLSLPKHTFMKHVTSRWLTMTETCKRVLEQWDALIEYFMKFIPQKKSKEMSSHKYQSITKILKDPTTKAQISFVIFSAKVFTDITGTLQKNEPLVHVIHSKLLKLARTLLLCFVKQDVVSSLENLHESIVEDKSNFLPPSQVECGQEASEILKNLTDTQTLLFKKGVQDHYIAAYKHIVITTPISKDILKYLTCLHPDNIKSGDSSMYIINLGNLLPINVDPEILLDEWKLLQVEVKISKLKEDQRIDHYWRSLFSKYQSIGKVVKACMCLSYGSADVERGFSLSGRLLSEDRAAMSSRTLDAKLTILSCMKKYGNKPELVPITTELLKQARCAAHNYMAYLEKKKKEKAEKEEKKKLKEEEKLAKEQAKKILEEQKTGIQELEKDLKNKKREEAMKRKAEEDLLSEAAKHIKTAIRHNDMSKVHLAQGMLEGIRKLQKDLEEDKKETEKIQSKVDKKKKN